MIVEPYAGDRVEENLNPVGRAYYAGVDVDLHAVLARTGGRARARRAGGRGTHARGRHGRRLHALPARDAVAVQPGLRGAALAEMGSGTILRHSIRESTAAAQNGTRPHFRPRDFVRWV